MEYLEYFDTCPGDESCSGDVQEQRAQARKYIKLLEKANPTPEGCQLKIKTNPHDFGDYISLEAHGDPDNEEHWAWCNRISNWSTWEELDVAAYPKKDGSIPFKIVLAYNGEQGMHTDFVLELVGEDHIRDMKRPDTLSITTTKLLVVDVRNYTLDDIKRLQAGWIFHFGEYTPIIPVRMDIYKDCDELVVRPFDGQTFFIW